MAEWLVVALAVIAAGMSALCLAAVFEVFQQLQEIRRRLALDDEPLELNIDAVDLADVAPADVVERDRSALMFLHSSCGMCRLVADLYAKTAPDGLWFVIPEHDVNRLKSFEDLAALGRVIADPDDGGLAEAMRLDVTPSIVLLRNGIVSRVLGVSSVSQATRIVQDADALGFLASAAFVTAAVAGAGEAVSGSEAAAIVAGACLAILAVLELTPVRRGPLRRQTSPILPRVFGPRVGAMLWGLDTGSMISTVRTSFGTYAVLIACAAGVAGGWAGVAYAVGFCVPLGVSLYAPLLGGRRATTPSHRLHRSLRAARVLLSGLMIGLAALLVA